MLDASNSSRDDGFVKFVNLFKLADLERALLPYGDSEQRAAIIRYYFACIALLDSPRLLQPVALFRQALADLDRHRVRRETPEAVGQDPEEESAPELSHIIGKVENFQQRLQSSVEQMKTPATEVPKILHFVWLGGGVGDIQRDYLGIWRKVLAGQGYKFNLWYDSDAFLAYKTNKLIVEAAKADAMEQGGAERSAEELVEMIEARATVLKQQMFAHINEAVARGESADEARIRLLTSAYGQRAEDLHALRQENLRSVERLAGEDLLFRDLGGAEKALGLRNIYDQEMRLRGNLAAASDVIRLAALEAEGGIYADIDNLPPLLKVLGGVDISGFDGRARLGTLQLLLNHNPDLMPGREALRDQYEDFTGEIPTEHRAALEAFAKGRPALNRVFQAPADRVARPYMLRAVAEQGSMSNAFLMAHANAGMLQTLQERFRFNYQMIDLVTREAAGKGITAQDNEAMFALAEQALERALGPFREMSDVDEYLASLLAGAIAGYYSDGIRPDSEQTIQLTGPNAMRKAMSDFERAHFTPEGAEASHKELAIKPAGTINRTTEEEQDHSWKENGNNLEAWADTQRQLWRDGHFPTRYAGDIAELLKHSTIEFELGWPLIEGRHVVETGLLQRMADRLGERFTDALRDGHDGPLSFADRLPLSFEDRQAIRNRPDAVRAPASLSDQQTRFLPLDDVLIRLAIGSLQPQQLTPLQRLTLAGLVGARTVTDKSLLEMSPLLDNLANSVSDRGTSVRYVAIEQHLFQQRAPEFLAGLASHDVRSPLDPESALELKRQALSRSTTLFEWGRRVARIQQVATREHREQVQDRVAQVLDRFSAGSVKLVPQDLLMQGPGDTAAGRCVPLSLAMSAALTQGDAATRQLRERFYLAALEPAQRDSIAFLNALEELRSVQLHEAGEALGRADLDMAVGVLEGSIGSRTLMLNSDNHAMLVARTPSGFHFYDPNFGLFEFADQASFSVALKQFFQTANLATHYATFGDPTRPQFDLIDLQGEKIGQIDLTSGFKVDHLLKDEALPDMPLQRARQRLNSAHGRTLADNPQLGSSLLELDSHGWAQQIADATSRLQEGHASATALVPLFDTLEMTLEGTWRLSMLDPANAEHVVVVTSHDSRLLRIKNYLSRLFSALARKPGPDDVTADPTQVGAVHTLNAAFAIQALFHALRGREGDDRTLTTAVQWHAYINYAQLVHGNAVDVAGLVGLVQAAIRDEKLIARVCGPVVGESLEPLAGASLRTVAGHVANEGVGTLLGLANLGFDIYQLSTAQNDIEKAQFGTQLAFDSASVVLGGAALAATLTGAVSAAAVLGGTSVILGGLAIGAAALAQAFATIAEEAKAVGLFFDELEQAHHGDGYRYDGARSAWLPRPSLIIKRLDLSAGKLLLDSTRLYPQRDHFGVPEMEVDYSRAIELSRELGYPEQMKFVAPAGQSIVLPCTPQTCYRYEYQILPFASQRHDKGFDIARRLEKKTPDGDWLFQFSFYSFPSHYIIFRMYPDYRPIEINVKLDARQRLLSVPIVPREWAGKVSYVIEGAADVCTLALNPGVAVRLESPGTQESQWMLLAPWAQESDVRFDRHGRLFIGDVMVTLADQGQHRLFVSFSGGAVLQVDYRAQHLLIAEAAAPAGLDGQLLQDHLQAIARDHRLLMRYTRVHNYRVPFEDPQTPRYTTGWYDAHEDRILYVRNENTLTDDAVLGVVSGDYAYFYQPDSFDIWQVDATTGWISHRYRLLLKLSGVSTVRTVAADGDGVVHVTQEYVEKDGTVERLIYTIHDAELRLGSIVRGPEPTFEGIFADAAPLADWSPVLGKYIKHPPVQGDDEVKTVDYQLAAYVSVCWKLEGKSRDMAWVRTRDNLVIRPVPGRHHGRGWNDSIQYQNELMLLPMPGDSDVFVIYDRRYNLLCRVKVVHANGQRSWTARWVQPKKLKHVLAVENGYLAVTEDGLFFNLGADGQPRLGGLDDAWIKGRSQWWLALEPLARQHEVEHFAIVGVRNFAGDARLSAWFVNDRLLLSEIGGGQEVRMLGVTPDNRAVWLFDVSRGEIWRQDFIDPQTLDQAFGTGAQLLSAELLPTPQREWASWLFKEVSVEGAGLRATSREGVMLELHFQQPASIMGVDRSWATAHRDGLAGQLQALLKNEVHRTFLSVDAGPGSRQWFIAHSGRLIRVPAMALPETFDMLGTQRHTEVLIHEPELRTVQAFPSERHFGSLDYVQRNGEVLVIEGDLDAVDLLPLIPDDVSTLVLRMGQGGRKCHLSREVARRLDSVVVDCRYPLGETPVVTSRLFLVLAETQKLELGIVEDHLVLVDPDSEHCLICRDVCSADPALRGDVQLDIKGLGRWPVSKLVKWLRQRNGGTDSVTLTALIEQSAASEKAAVG